MTRDCGETSHSQSLQHPADCSFTSVQGKLHSTCVERTDESVADENTSRKNHSVSDDMSRPNKVRLWDVPHQDTIEAEISTLSDDIPSYGIFRRRCQWWAKDSEYGTDWVDWVGG